MERSTFVQHFETSATALLAATRECVIEVLPDTMVYLVKLRCSHDGNPLMADERVFPDDPEPTQTLGPFTTDAVVDLLWRDGWVPEWIDLTVHTADDATTTMLLECCGRFTTGTHLYHTKRSPPFATKIGPLPPGLKAGERFSLNWRKHQRQ